jgi:hypothetical protein
MAALHNAPKCAVQGWTLWMLLLLWSHEGHRMSCQ